MSHTLGIRQAQKQKTRQALMDSALQLLEHQSLSSLGLREVTRAVGMAPAAFYRHFTGTADLGVALVEQALGSLHDTIRAAIVTTGSSEERIDRAVALIAAQVRTHPAHVRFIARERHGGVAPVREAIGVQLRAFGDEVAEALGADPESAGWPPEDVRMLAGVYVDHMVMTASALLEGDEGSEEAVLATARAQLRLVTLGRHHWLD
ncbi:transcriptional regulator [Streptomyces xanthochromogenes]|uniref:TetR family transcriptional regulator n=1 Tax=Streptomyces TaxID=1883 RepID=UPI00141DAA99|nr:MULTISPECIES: TetR family transcriptional regulator [Streptomyces]GHB49667.1 transcriptional regulator [Streptomyces xanthochromogenes]